ncbi:hypothetical protein B0H13DRAFT_1634832 [Mycena leptocephala]|nr:hypothetical protein B0H13DRAFT_1634832 [Mycena leptocephala]
MPDLIYFSIQDPGIILDPAIHLTVGDNRGRFALRGVIYLGENHYTSQIVKETGTIWYHDGIETRGKCECDGVLHALPPRAINTCRVSDLTRSVLGVIYAKEL